MKESFNVALGRWQVKVDGRWQYRYRYIMEAHLGRSLRTDEHVHHINGDPTDDRLENLEVLSASDHHKLHAPETKTAQRARMKFQWSHEHPCCVRCSTTEGKHVGHGLCSRCYFRQRYLPRVVTQDEKLAKRLTRYEIAVKAVERGEGYPWLAEAVRLLREGLTGTEIARRLGMSNAQVYKGLANPYGEARKAETSGVGWPE